MNEMLNLHVSPAGDNHWSGKLANPVPGGEDGPLATLSEARDAIRRWRATDGGTGGYLHRDGRISMPLKGILWKSFFYHPRMQWDAWKLCEEMGKGCMGTLPGAN
jgi:hypothetical protein